MDRKITREREKERDRLTDIYRHRHIADRR